MRGVGVVLGMLLAGFSSARILLETRFQEDPRMIRASSRLLICPDTPLVEFAESQRSKENAEGIKAAVEFSREALKRNDASPYRWCDLGFALLDSGQKEQARYCFERALKLGPDLVTNLSRVADYYNRVKEPRKALRCVSRILDLAPSEQNSFLAAYASGGYDPTDILNYGLPDNAPVARSYFRYLLSTSGSFESVREAWKWLGARSYPDTQLTNQYVDFLMQNVEYEQAVTIWLAHLGQGRGTYLTSDFLYNGGFESEPSGSVFDWRVGAAQGVEAARDPAVAHSGRWSLRVSFSGESNVNYRHAAQEVVLKPGSYRFRAYARTQDITTDKGIAFRIYDADMPGLLDVRTEQLVGTHDWTELKADVPVAGQASRIRVELARNASEKFDNKISGTVWIDDLRMTIDEFKGRGSLPGD